MSNFDELMARVQQLTGLSGRDAAKVAFEFEPEEQPRPQDIIEKAAELGFDVEVKHGQQGNDERAQPHMLMDPAAVLTEIYMACPRVLSHETPRMGRAPDEINRYEQLAGVMSELPEDIQAMLVKIDLLEGQATFWIRDEANSVDRPIGPVDITRYGSEHALEQAFTDLMKRMDRVLAADHN